MAQPLALLGGPPAVTVRPPRLPILEEQTIIGLRGAIEFARNDWSYLSSIAGGGPVEELEQKFAGVVQARHALALSSCTAALHVALLALGIGLGDEVIVPTYTWGQSVAPVLHCGAVPVFADVAPESYTLDPSVLPGFLSPRTRAIIAVHLFGHPADMQAINAFARQHGLAVVEDCAQAIGARYRGRPVGSWGDAGCFSLGRGKAVTGGEGGVLVTNRRRVFERAIYFSQHPLRQKMELSGRLRAVADEFGFNFRIHPLAAVIASHQLDRLPERLQRRSACYQALTEKLSGIPYIRPVRVAKGCEHAWYLYAPSYAAKDLDADVSIARADYVAALAAEGVPICEGPIMQPLHRRRGLQSMAEAFKRHQLVVRRGHFPVAMSRCQRTGISLGAWLPDAASEELLSQIATAFLKVAEQARALASACQRDQCRLYSLQVAAA